MSLPRVRFPRPVLFFLGAVVLTACGGKADTSGEKPVPVTTRAVEMSSAPIVLEAVGRTEGSK